MRENKKPGMNPGLAPISQKRPWAALLDIVISYRDEKSNTYLILANGKIIDLCRTAVGRSFFYALLALVVSEADDVPPLAAASSS